MANGLLGRDDEGVSLVLGLPPPTVTVVVENEVIVVVVVGSAVGAAVLLDILYASIYRTSQ